MHENMIVEKFLHELCMYVLLIRHVHNSIQQNMFSISNVAVYM